MVLGSHHSEESRARLSVSHMGKCLPAEQRAKISATEKGKKCSPETRAKMSAGQMGNKNALGLPVSLETRAKIGLASRNKSLEVRAYIAAALWKGGPKVWQRKRNAKRRILGFVPLNKPFDGCEGHHVDKEQAIYLPRALHRSIYHRQDTGQGMAQMNAVAYNYLFKQEVEAAMAQRMP